MKFEELPEEIKADVQEAEEGLKEAINLALEDLTEAIREFAVLVFKAGREAQAKQQYAEDLGAKP